MIFFSLSLNRQTCVVSTQLSRFSWAKISQKALLQAPCALYVRAAKALSLVRLCECAASSGPSLFVYAARTKIF